MSAERLDDKRLATLSRWADDGGNGAGHIFHGECPWCTIGGHDVAADLLAEVARLRQIEEAATALEDVLADRGSQRRYVERLSAARSALRAALPEAPQDRDELENDAR